MQSTHRVYIYECTPPCVKKNMVYALFFGSFGLRVMSSGEHPLLACTCAVCHTWRRVGFLLVSPDRPESFRVFALQRIRDFYLELLDVVEGVGRPPPVAAGGVGNFSREGEAGSLQEAQALAEASSKAPPPQPPRQSGKDIQKREDHIKESEEKEKKEAEVSEAKKIEKKEEFPEGEKKKDKKKKDKKSEKRKRVQTGKGVPVGEENPPEVVLEGAEEIKAKEEEQGQDVLSEVDYEEDSPELEQVKRSCGRSPSLSRKHRSPERRRKGGIGSPERRREVRRQRESDQRRGETSSPGRGRGSARDSAPDKEKEEKRKQDKKKEKRRSRSRSRRRRSSPRREDRERRGEERRSPVRERREQRGEDPPVSAQGHLRPAEPKVPPRYKPLPTAPPPGVFGWSPPYWYRYYSGEQKSKGVKRRERNQDIRAHGLDEERKLLRKSRGG